MPVVLWKSGALAPRKARRINNGLSAPVVAYRGERSFSATS